ncbi:MAG: hypothetical protein NWQ46_03990 [Spirosomaceae bacterium]|nr:hypothetical protein [Spirosomataceae bacterium]
MSTSTPPEPATKSGLITANETWTNDRIYFLGGKVVVTDGVTLTIQEGTIIKGNAGEGSLASALIVARGGKINAKGTAARPIIFTAAEDNIALGQKAGTNLPDETEEGQGRWGGLIILGKAPISVEVGAEAQIEGIPADESYGRYGGTEAADNSGVLEYVSIRHGGITIGANNEINGLTLGGVGSGTVINNVEVANTADDGIEFFGGTVNVTNALVWSQGDDGYDVDQAYAGTVTNFIYIAGNNSDHGLEIDGPEGSTNASGRFTMTRGSLKFKTAELADFRDAAQGTITNCYFFNFSASADWELDDIKSSNNFFNGSLVFTGNQYNLSTANVAFNLLFKDTATGGKDAEFKTKMTTDNTAVTARTVGATAADFSWTYAAGKNALTGF